MFEYSGYECTGCRKKFTDTSDIVVCPDCGTPYHRECWKKQGKCINFTLHENHVSWKTIAETEQIKNLRCRKCGGELDSNQLYCDVCGTPTDYFLKQNGINIDELGLRRDRNENGADYRGLYGNGQRPSGSSDSFTRAAHPFMINYSDPLCGLNPEEKFEDDVTVRDVADFVGKNTHYYLPRFHMMNALKMKWSINFPALFFPEIYFAYRKMPFIALMILLFKTVIGLPATALSIQEMFGADAPSQFGNMLEMFRETFPFLAENMDNFLKLNLSANGTFTTLMAASNILNWVTIVVFGVFSNYIYYRNTLRKASVIRKNSDGSDCTRKLRDAGGTSPIAMVVFIFLMFLMEYVGMGLILYLMG